MAKDLTENNALVKDYAAARNKSVDALNVTVGNNGYSLGQEFHCTGVMEVVKTTINGNVAYFIGVKTEEGVDLSLRALMGVSSMKGYSTKGSFDNQSRSKHKGEVETKQVTAEVVDNFDFTDVWQPMTRNFMDLIAECDSTHYFAGKKVTYLGNAVREYTATKDSPSTSIDIYDKGDKRAISVRLWSVENN